MTMKRELQSAVMDVCWNSGRALTATEVLEQLPGPRLAATTVYTVLTRLEAKQLLARQPGGHPHRYRPTRTREESLARLMHDALGQTTKTETTLARFLGNAAPGDTATLRRLLAPMPANGHSHSPGPSRTVESESSR